MPILRLLGPVRIEIGGETRPVRLAPKGIELLGYLCSHEAPISRDALATLLWPDTDPDDARANIRRQLHNLTRALPEHTTPYVLATHTSLQWNPAAEIAVDVTHFRAALAACGDAVAWYGGDFLQGFSDDWILVERERLREQCIGSLFDRIRRKRGERDLRGALDDVMRLLAIDPWREDVVRIEMTLRNQLADRGGALATYRAFSARLLQELDTEPMPATRALFDGLARGDEPSDADAVREPGAQRDTRRGLPLRGRDAELVALTGIWASAARGASSVVLIGGEAGVGKSRLAHELALHAESEGAHVFVGTTSPGEGSPHEALVEALRSALALIERTTRDPSSLAGLLPLLPELETRDGIVEQAPLDDLKARVRLFDAVATAFGSIAASRPLMLILEDMHWAGAASLDLLQFLARRGGRSPILLVATYREEEVRATHPLRALRKTLEAESLLRNVALARLDDASAASIVRAALGDATDEVTVADIVAKSDGLPLFLSEAIGDPTRVPGVGGLNVAGRLAALPDDARTIVEIAAVAGSGFDVDLLCEASGWPEAAVVRGLGPLISARLIREPYRRTRSDFVFSHHLIVAAIYDGIAQAERTRRHGRIGAALAELAGPPAPDRAAEIAAHFLRGARFPEAAAWYARAAEHAASVWATEDAIEFARLAIEHGDAPEQTIAMRLLRMEVAMPTLHADVVAHELEQLDRCNLDPEDYVRREKLRSMHLRQEGRNAEARATVDRALVFVETHAISPLNHCALLDECAYVARAEHDFSGAEAYAQALESIGAGTRYALLATFHLGTIEMRRAHFDRMYEINARALGQARESGDIFSEALAGFYLAIADQNRGRFDEAEETYKRTKELLVRCDLQRLLHNLMLNQTSLAGSRGDYAAMLPVHAEIERRTQTHFVSEHSLINLVNWAMCEVCLGNPVRAEELLAPHEPKPDATASDQTAVWWFVMGLAAWVRTDHERACTHLVRSLEIYRELGVSGVLALTAGFAALATLDAGDPSAARALAREATTIPSEIVVQSDFPHVALWALAATASGTEASDAYATALVAFEERRASLGTENRARAYTDVPWNARFLTDYARRAHGGHGVIASKDSGLWMKA